MMFFSKIFNLIYSVVVSLSTRPWNTNGRLPQVDARDAFSRDVAANPRLSDDDGGVDADGTPSDATGETGVYGEGVGTELELEENGEDGGKGNAARVVAARREELAAKLATPEG